MWSSIDTPISKPRQGLLHSLGRIDALGGLTLGFSMAFLLLGLTLKTSTGKYSWHSPVVIGLCLGSFILAISFVLVEWRVASEPLLPLRFLRLVYSCGGTSLQDGDRADLDTLCLVPPATFQESERGARLGFERNGRIAQF